LADPVNDAVMVDARHPLNAAKAQDK
jgi:hypothetical protein